MVLLPREGFDWARSRRGALLAVCGSVLLIAWADRVIGPSISPGVLYLFPILAGAAFLNRLGILALALVCTALREAFGPFPAHDDLLPRSLLVFTGYLGAALFVSRLVRRQRETQAHLVDLRREMDLRRDAEEQLRSLVETTPAPILLLDAEGKVVLCNAAAQELLRAGDGHPLTGESIDNFIPALASILRAGDLGGYFRTRLEETGRRCDGESFVADLWVSAYHSLSGPRVAAVVLDASEGLRDQQQAALESLLADSRILVGAVSHEVRNLCDAIQVVEANLRRVPDLAGNADVAALSSLVEALREIAGLHLSAQAHHHSAAAAIDLAEVLEDLRIIVGPTLRDLEVNACWDVPQGLPKVRANRHALVQASLNLAQNAARALEKAQRREWKVEVTATGPRVSIRFWNSGPPVTHPGALFRPFQPGAEGLGLGLFISRALVRSFGGNLYYATADGSPSFVLELQAAGVEETVCERNGSLPKKDSTALVG